MGYGNVELIIRPVSTKWTDVYTSRAIVNKIDCIPSCLLWDDY